MRPDVNQMDERNGERDGEPDVCADPKKLFEIDKQDGCDEENEQQQQMNHLTFEENRLGTRGIRGMGSSTLLIVSYEGTASSQIAWEPITT